MRLACGVLGWTPRTFWEATPRELAAALEGRFGRLGPPVDRAALHRLMAAYPDAAIPPAPEPTLTRSLP